MVTEMIKYNFILLSTDVDAFLRMLQSAGIVDITRSQLPVDDESKLALEQIEKLQKAIEILKNVPETALVKAKTNNAVEEVIDLFDKKNTINQKLTELNAENEELQPWGIFSIADIEKLEHSGLKIHFYKVKKAVFQEAWAEQYALSIISEQNGNVFFVIVSDSDDYNFELAEEIHLTRSLSEVQNEINIVKKSLSECDTRLSELKTLTTDLESELQIARISLDRLLATASGEKASDNYLTVFEGFAPKEKADELQKNLDVQNILYLAENAVENDNPPIKLKNNKFVSMFEVLTDMYGRPRYSEFDPTIWISIFFMLFFAFCMGDAGYGLILIMLGVLLKSKLQKLSPLVVTLGVATTIIGLLFHTFFSTDMLNWQSLPVNIKKLMLPPQIAGYDGTMVLAIIIGVIHLCLAMIVKTYQSTKNLGFSNSLGVWGWTLLIVGSVVVGALALIGVLNSEVTKLIIIALGVLSALGIFLLNDLHRNPLLNIGAGLWNTYNTATGLLGDVLSYLRLYALGLAGAKLGEAFNAIATQALGNGGAGWIFFVLIVVVGHTLNLAMCALGAFVHPLRLNFLEFFKNSGYEGTGRKYNPLTENINN